MATWKMEEAKTSLNEVIEEADKNGPPIITTHGSEHAVVVSVVDDQALKASAPNLVAASSMARSSIISI